MKRYQLADGTPVEVTPGPLTKTFLNVRVGDQKPYLVWADTLRYRKDDKPDDKAIFEVE